MAENLSDTVQNSLQNRDVNQPNKLHSYFSKLKLCSGIFDDLVRRIPYYIDDWKCFSWASIQKVSASSIYMFFTSLAPAITFAMLLTTETKQLIGVLEVLLSTAIGGCAFSLFAGQPLVIVGVTGPIVILTISMYTLTDTWNINFLAFYAWAQLWAALMHLLISVFNLCNLIKYVTNFSCETFGILIATIFIYDGLRGISKYFEKTNGRLPEMSSVYLQLLIALGTIYLSLALLGAKRWTVLNNTCRTLLCDYGITLAVLVMSAVAYMGRNQGVHIQRLETPNTFGTTTPRSWLVDLTALPLWAIFTAILPGFIITVLFAFDHNISSLMAQAREYGLKKGPSFHFDFLVLGLCLVITGGKSLLGLPPTSGMIPHSFLHTRSLISTVRGMRGVADVEVKSNESGRYDAVEMVCGGGGEGDVEQQQQSPQQIGDSASNIGDADCVKAGSTTTQPPNNTSQPIPVTHLEPTILVEETLHQIVYEQRVSNLVQSLLIGLMCFPPFIRYLQVIPRSTLDGLFVILGVSSFEGNQFFERMVHLINDPKRRTAHKYLQNVKHSSITRLTLVQMACCATIFCITFTPIDMIFPILIGVLVPVRLFVLPRYVDGEDQQQMDPLNTESILG